MSLELCEKILTASEVLVIFLVTQDIPEPMTEIL